MRGFEWEVDRPGRYNDVDRIVGNRFSCTFKDSIKVPIYNALDVQLEGRFHNVSHIARRYLDCWGTGITGNLLRLRPEKRQTR